MTGCHLSVLLYQPCSTRAHELAFVLFFTRSCCLGNCDIGKRCYDNYQCYLWRGYISLLELPIFNHFAVETFSSSCLRYLLRKNLPILLFLMSTGEHHEDLSEEMSAELPPLKCPRATFDGLIQNLKFPESWGALYPEEGQTAADTLAGYVILFWDFFCEGNFRLPVTKFFLEILGYYKLHISQLHPIGMVRVCHFEFVCQTMHIEPIVPRFRVFYQMHCTQGFYSFVQRASAKKILQHPPKSFHDWKQKIFFIKARVIPMRMVLRGKEDVPIETIQTPVDENWYQDLSDVPNIALPEKALVGASMSLNWRMDREDKPVYTEDNKGKNGAFSLFFLNLLFFFCSRFAVCCCF
ncbi:hypothetical protein HanRHA438_Chr17g0815791 [Helianthus annuus]|nr:hypothetical protein HanHA89_Chr17g0708851 [Helianthus annuus]KAJ0632645.1 hypothetical protein HanLR1_Chr17g0667471 [Helianthus annuus]KAJ0826567.1 hypothetical protein HanRHA438_Chr17g0815791 [Helianthus annuus]